jgi:hypothetical protein
MGQKNIFTVCQYFTLMPSTLMLFEGRAGEAVERSDVLSYPFPVEIKVSRVSLLTFPYTHSFIHSFNQTSNTDTAGASV